MRASRSGSDAPYLGQDDVSGSRLVRNTAVNGLASLVVGLLAIVVTPVLLHRLGAAEYGVWLLGMTLTFQAGFAGLADLGLQQAGIRMVAAARAAGAQDEISELIATMLWVFAAIGALVAFGLVAVAPLFVTVMGVPDSLHDVARATFSLLGLQLALDLPSAAMLALLEGAQRYPAVRSVDVGARLAVSVVGIVVVTTGGGAVALAVTSVAVAGVGFLAALALARRAQPGLHLSVRLVKRRTIWRLARQGAPLTAIRVLSITYSQMDRIIVGVALSAAAVAEYEIAYKVHALALIVLALAPSAVMPATSYLGSAGDSDRLRALYLQGTRYALAVSLPVAVAAFAYAPSIIRTWVGGEYTDVADTTRLFLTYPALVAVHTVGVTMLVGLGRMRELVGLTLGSVTLNLVASIALVHRYGITGVVLGTLLGYVVLWLPYFRLLFREFVVVPGQFFREVVLPVVPGVAVQVAFCLTTLGIAGAASSLVAVGLLVASSVVMSLACFLLILGGEERRRLARQFLRRT